MSLFQNYSGNLIQQGSRTEEQKALFGRCMNSMHLWYGCVHIQIWMMTTSAPTTDRNYMDRGWCAH